MTRKNTHGIFLLAFVIILFSSCTTGNNTEEPEEQPNPQIQKLLGEVSADSIEANIRELVSFHTRHTMSDTASDSIGIGAARRWIYSRFNDFSSRSGNRLEVSYDSYVETENRRISRPTEIVNVVAELPGTQPESENRIYVVSGHYDSRVSDIMNDTSFAPGANDDASGTAAVMELARVMSQHEFDATIVFMAVAGEEQGLLGASHYAQTAKEEGRNIEAMFTNDIIGSSVADDGSVHDEVVRVFAEGIPPERELSNYHRMLLYTGGENDNPSRQLARSIHEAAEMYMDDFRVNVIYRKDRYLRGGDHSAFLEQGYPAVRFSEPNEDYRHQHQDVREEGGVQYGDLVQFVDFEYVADVTRLNAAALATLANAPAKPQKVGVEVQQLENNTTLRWEASHEPDLKGYEIVWRNTNAPFWEYSKFVGNKTRYTVKGVSKDNYLFGVRAVDTAGHKSPAVYPLPVRN